MMTSLTDRIAAHDAFRLECVRFYGAATFWFSQDDAPLKTLRSAFDRCEAAEAAWKAAREADDAAAALAAPVVEGAP